MPWASVDGRDAGTYLRGRDAGRVPRESNPASPLRAALALSHNSERPSKGRAHARSGRDAVVSSVGELATAFDLKRERDDPVHTVRSRRVEALWKLQRSPTDPQRSGAPRSTATALVVIRRRDPTRGDRDLVAPRNEGVQGSSARVDFGKRRRLNRSGPQEGRTGRCILRRRMCVGDFMSRTFSIAVFMSGT